MATPWNLGIRCKLRCDIDTFQVTSFWKLTLEPPQVRIVERAIVTVGIVPFAEGFDLKVLLCSDLNGNIAVDNVGLQGMPDGYPLLHALV